jgi:hypothetical protein
MLFREFTALCQRLEATRSHLEKVSLTADFLRALSEAEIPAAVAFLAGLPFSRQTPASSR